MKAPAFWYRQKSVWAELLKPISFVYAYSVARRFKKATPYQSDVPVICVGNLTVGGTGKTPLQTGKSIEVCLLFLCNGRSFRRK